ncbi:MAG: hypothetical protein WAM14_17725 [Candidatus Nitrosopolaris sp.]
MLLVPSSFVPYVPLELHSGFENKLPVMILDHRRDRRRVDLPVKEEIRPYV